jgi:hypothetical protein
MVVLWLFGDLCCVLLLEILLFKCVGDMIVVHVFGFVGNLG